MAETFTAHRLQLEVALFVLDHYKAACDKMGSSCAVASLLLRARPALIDHFTRKLEVYEEREEESAGSADTAIVGVTTAPPNAPIALV